MLEKAKIIVPDNNIEIPVMYNPTELNSDISVEVTGEGSNIQFQKVLKENLTVSLFFDTYEKGTDVRQETKKIEALLNPTIGKQNRREPAVCVFVWSKIWYKGIIIGLQQKYTMFLSSGIPVRAQLTVTFKSVLTEREEIASLGLWNCRKLWQVKKGERLDWIAFETLGDSQLWSLIATANQIYDPFTFPKETDIGKTIVIPDVLKQ